MTLPTSFKPWRLTLSGRLQTSQPRERATYGHSSFKFYSVSIPRYISVDLVLSILAFAVLWTALIQLLLWRDERIATKVRVTHVPDSELESSIEPDAPSEADQTSKNIGTVSIVPTAEPLK